VIRPSYPDSLCIWDAVVGLPEQIEQARVASTEVLSGVTLPVADDIRSIAVFGMGPSGTAGDVVAASSAAYSSVPVWVGKGYDVPAFVGPHTLVFAVSFSGETEETVATASAAADAGAHVVAVTGDGPLADFAAAAKVTRFMVPAGLKASRTALGATVVPLLMTLAECGVIPDISHRLAAIAEALGRRRDTLVALPSEAEEVARSIGRTIPLIYGASDFGAAAAQRWKTQINENAKTPAFSAALPELSHNEVAGWGQHGDVTRQVFSLITLRQAGEHPQVARQFDLVIDATDEVMSHVIPVWSQGHDDLGRFFDLALFGDLVSLHLAGREGIDPGPVPALDDVRVGLQ